MKKYNNIYYITRTWTPNGNSAGNLRKIYADFLSELGNVIIVCPNYQTSEDYITSDMISMSYCHSRYGQTYDIMLQRLRVKDDYLDGWVKKTYRYLRYIVNDNDLIFATTGGELACIKLAAMLKKQTNCKMIINYRDPVNGIHIKNEITPGFRGFSRDSITYKYSKWSDAFITSSKWYEDVLKEQFHDRKNNIYCHYIGYKEKAKIKERSLKNTINIVYSGAMTNLQQAEILYNALKNISNIQITYICNNPKMLKTKMPEDNVTCIDLMPHKDYLLYMQTNADVGFVSLHSDFARVYVPSKIFEYINLEIPILGSLPNADAKKIINENGYGIACEDGNIKKIQEAALLLTDEKTYNQCLENIRRDKEKWYCENRKDEFLDILQDLIDRGVI